MRTFCLPRSVRHPGQCGFSSSQTAAFFSWLAENGRVCALNFPIAMNAGLAKALGVMLKLDFARAVSIACL